MFYAFVINDIRRGYTDKIQNHVGIAKNIIGYS